MSIKLQEYHSYRSLMPCKNIAWKSTLECTLADDEYRYSLSALPAAVRPGGPVQQFQELMSHTYVVVVFECEVVFARLLLSQQYITQTTRISHLFFYHQKITRNLVTKSWLFALRARTQVRSQKRIYLVNYPSLSKPCFGFLENYWSWSHLEVSIWPSHVDTTLDFGN